MDEDTPAVGLHEAVRREARHSAPFAIVCIVGWTIVGASIPLFGRHPPLTAGLALASWGFFVATNGLLSWVVGIDGVLTSTRIVGLISVFTLLGFVEFISVLLFRIPAAVLLLYGIVAGIGIYILAG
jgi:hypothetical protein